MLYQRIFTPFISRDLCNIPLTQWLEMLNIYPTIFMQHLHVRIIKLFMLPSVIRRNILLYLKREMKWRTDIHIRDSQISSMSPEDWSNMMTKTMFQQYIIFFFLAWWLFWRRCFIFDKQGRLGTECNIYFSIIICLK